MAEYELIYRSFERTLIHERRYVYTGQSGDSFAFSYFDEVTTHYFQSQLANFRTFGLPQPQKGSFRRRDVLGRERIGIYMDDLFLCPKCGSFFLETTPYFDALRNRSEPFNVALEALIASRANAAEFVVAECRQISECNERRMRQERQTRRDEQSTPAAPYAPLVQPPVPKSLYVLRIGEAYKIGVAVDVAARIKSLQSASPSPISLLKEWRASDARRCEKLLHARFRRYRVSGEWFSLPKEEVEWLISLEERSLQALD